MIHEFAIEAEAVATWEHFRLLWPGLGVGEGRFLVEYPRKWRKRVYELADKLSKPVQAHSIKSKLGDMNARRAKLVGVDGRDFDGGDWLSNAVRQQAGKKSFRAIITLTKFEDRPDVLPAHEFDPDSEPWHVATQMAIPRKARDMCEVASPLLRHSEELLLVDRHFNPRLSRYRKPFKGLVSVRPEWKRLEIHTTNNRDVLEADYLRLKRLVPHATKLTVVLWPTFPQADKMHARYVLTERGGISYDWGLDEGQTPDQTTEVRLVEQDRHLQLREQYHRDARRFGTPVVWDISGGV